MTWPELTALAGLALLLAGCGGEEYYFWHRVAGRTVGPVHQSGGVRDDPQRRRDAGDDDRMLAGAVTPAR
jgi:hypothetical protein